MSPIGSSTWTLSWCSLGVGTVLLEGVATSSESIVNIYLPRPFFETLDHSLLFSLIFLLTSVLSPLLSLDAWRLDSRIPFPFHSTDYVFCSWPQLLFAGATWHRLVSCILVKNVIIHAQRKDTLPLTSPIHVLSYRRVSNHHHPPGAPHAHL